MKRDLYQPACIVVVLLGAIVAIVQLGRFDCDGIVKIRMGDMASLVTRLILKQCEIV